MMAEWKIAKIRKAEIKYEDHGILTIMLDLDYGGMSQGAGGYGYGTRGTKYPDGRLFEHLTGIMQACDVSRWDQVVGRTVYALCDHGKVYALKPLPTEKGKDFYFEEKMVG